MSVGEKVADLRSKLGMTQEELAEAAGIAQATISRVERGVLRQPKLGVLRRLAEALHVTVDYLADRTKQMSASDVVSEDPRAEVIFRGYQEMTEQQRAALLAFVKALRDEAKPKRATQGE